MEFIYVTVTTYLYTVWLNGYVVATGQLFVMYLSMEILHESYITELDVAMLVVSS